MIDSRSLDKAITYLSSRIPRRPKIALVLGSGLGDFANQLIDPIEVSASTIPTYPVATVEGHEGMLAFGTLESGGRASLPLLVFKGRVHFYESGNADVTTFPVHIAHALGANILLTTNAAGGINRSFSEGDLMLIEDFIDLSFLGASNDVSPKDPGHFQMRSAGIFDEELSTLISDAGKSLDIMIRRGTYCYLRGPSYETKAEIEMLHRIGADAVGMSTVPEVIAAANLGMRVAAISLISNLAAGLGGERLSHKEVAETAMRVKQKFTALLTDIILRIAH